MDTYSNTVNNATTITLSNGQVANLWPNPTGSASDGHYMAAVGYDGAREEIYLLQSWGEDRFDMTWQKMVGLTKTYWLYHQGTNRNAFIVPSGISINEVLAPPAPTAAFTANVTSGDSPLTVKFTDSSTNSPLVWSWVIGGANSSTVQSPTYTFNGAGAYSVSLNASNYQGYNSITKTNYILVGGATPTPTPTPTPTTPIPTTVVTTVPTVADPPADPPGWDYGPLDADSGVSVIAIALGIIGISLIVVGGWILISAFSSLSGMARPDTLMIASGAITVGAGATLLLISYVILSPLATVATL